MVDRGDDGCKIKALRAKTNTYIKTPVRGEEPVFVVTGRKEDVNKAKREILSAADHFSLIRASRKPSTEGLSIGISVNGSTFGGSTGRAQMVPPILSGQITIQVRVPYRVVGLVVGPKGGTIKHIQQETQTYIVTPSREKEPIFEVTGLPDNVQTARTQIESHIALRTGSLRSSENGTERLDTNKFINFNTINTLTQVLNDDLNPDTLSSIYKNDASPTLDFIDNSINISKPKCINIKAINCANLVSSSEVVDAVSSVEADNYFPGCKMHLQFSKINKSSFCRHDNTISAIVSGNKVAAFYSPSSTNSQCISTTSNSVNVLTRSCSSASSTASNKSTNNSANSSKSVNTPPELINIWKNVNDSIDIDEGIGESPSIWNMPTTEAALSRSSPNASISPTESLLDDRNQKIRKYREKRENRSAINSTSSLEHGRLELNQNTKNSTLNRECFICKKKKVTTALVPCGHNMFCMNCANEICVAVEPVCPICSSIVYHAMRILA